MCRTCSASPIAVRRRSNDISSATFVWPTSSAPHPGQVVSIRTPTSLPHLTCGLRAPIGSSGAPGSRLSATATSEQLLDTRGCVEVQHTDNLVGLVPKFVLDIARKDHGAARADSKLTVADATGQLTADYDVHLLLVIVGMRPDVLAGRHVNCERDEPPSGLRRIDDCTKRCARNQIAVSPTDVVHARIVPDLPATVRVQSGSSERARTRFGGPTEVAPRTTLLPRCSQVTLKT